MSITAIGFALFMVFGVLMVLGGAGAAGAKSALQDRIDNAITIATAAGFLLLIAGITVRLWRTMP
jgi:hypothetical protein